MTDIRINRIARGYSVEHYEHLRPRRRINIATVLLAVIVGVLVVLTVIVGVLVVITVAEVLR